MRVQSLHQIEITSRCNLRCKYCPHPHMTRPKVDMNMETFERCLHWVRRFVKEGTQGPELNLAGIGESTLHPEFEDMVRLARLAVQDKVRLILATNGIEIVKRPALAEVLSRYDVYTWVSLHRPEKGGPAVEILKEAGVLKGVSADPSLASINWAGQVEWFVSTPTAGEPCMWLRDGKVMVMADGRVTRCCLDAEGEGVIGDVHEICLTEKEVSPYSLCDGCHLDASCYEAQDGLATVSG